MNCFLLILHIFKNSGSFILPYGGGGGGVIMLYKLWYNEYENGTIKNENGTMKLRTLQYNIVNTSSIPHTIQYCTIPS